jgi:accessory colonization factor AcfC
LDNDPTFRDWLSRRSLIVFGKDLYDEKGQFDTLAGEQAWTQFGVWTAANPDIQESVTPEKYADMLYNTYGGDAAYDRLMEEKAKANEKENPITRRTTVSSMTMNKQAAEAAVDDLARGLLGRMASGAELARYRKQINAFLKANPNVRTEVQDATDPNNIKVTSNEKAGATPTDAANVLEMKLRRGSEGMAFNVGQMFEEALAGMDRNL